MEVDGGPTRAPRDGHVRDHERSGALSIVDPVLRLAAWLVIATTGAVMLTQAIGWSGTRLVAALQSLTPYAIVALAPIAVVAAVRGLHRMGFTAALVGISGLVLAVPLVFAPDQPPVDAAAGSVEVASVNLLFHNEIVGEAADAVFARDADVIVFSEYTAEHQTALRRHARAGDFPFRIERDGLKAGGVAIWSRTPLAEGDRLPTTNFSIDAVVDGPGGPFTVVAVHPPTPVFDFEAWKRDLELIHDRARAASTPTLLIGDFNASYWHPLFRDLLDAGFVDAHIAHGKGFSTSWPTGDWRPTFVRLDHALTGHGLVSTGVEDFHVPGSDHRGFVVTVARAR